MGCWSFRVAEARGYRRLLYPTFLYCLSIHPNMEVIGTLQASRLWTAKGEFKASWPNEDMKVRG